MKKKLLSLLKWCKKNYLAFDGDVDKDDSIITIAGKKFYLILPGEDGKVLRKDCTFVLDEEDVEEIKGAQIDYILFEFGQQWYYCEKKIKLDDYNDEHLEANFVDLKYIGQADGLTGMPYCHLGVHSEYELLNGSHKADYWVKKAKFLDQKYLGICDKNTLAGVLAFQMACDKEGLKSILGITATVGLGDKDNFITYQIKLYAADEQGWQNLLYVAKSINVENDGFIMEDDLLEHATGLVAVFEKESQLNYLPVAQGKKMILRFKVKFAKIYYGIDSVEFYADNDDIEHLRKIQTYFTDYASLIPAILLNDSYYLEKELYSLKLMLNKVGNKAEKYTEDQHFKTVEETYKVLSKMFKDEDAFFELFNELCENTVELAEFCTYKINTGEHKLPRYQFAKDGMSNEEFFWELIGKGIEEKLMNKEYHYPGMDMEAYTARIEKEAKVILGANFVDYFLILWDIVSWSKKNGIMVGTGRGSVTGCLLAYLLDVTTVDPVKHDLLFERFLNETRVSGERAKAADSMPDVDLDFASDRREEVKDYIRERFGQLHVCNIGAYGRLKLKSAIKDFGKQKGLDFQYLNRITKDIDDQQEYTFKDFIKYSVEASTTDLYDFIQKHPDIVHLIKYGMGQAKTASIHASAVIIVPAENKEGKPMNIFNWLPTRRIDGKLTSEWEGKYTDRGGFLKEDILGLSQLDKFTKILQLIKQNYKQEINIDTIPLDDENVYKLFKKGYNDDVFQFTSVGLKAYSKEVKPEDIEDLTAMTSLYRPGPMDSNAHKDFAAIKHGFKEAEYDQGFEIVTQKTHGLLIYQEQIMQSMVVAGFSLVEADQARTMIKKFDKVGMAKLREKLIEGLTQKGVVGLDGKQVYYTQEMAEAFWAKILAFSGYGFNRSHALAYSLISYFSMWFKANYPLEFWTAALNYSKDDLIPGRLSEIKKLKQGIGVKPPDINISDIQFECNTANQMIYWSLTKIASLGEKKVEAILEARKQHGRFNSYADFVEKVPKKSVNKSTVLALILSGAFDEVEKIDEDVTERLTLVKKHYRRLGEELPEEYKDVQRANKEYFWILKQRDFTGFGDVSYGDTLKQVNKKMGRYYMNPEQLQKSDDYEECTVCGIVVFQRERIPKNKEKPRFLTLELMCNNEVVNVILWSETYAEYKTFFQTVGKKLIAISGKTKYDSYKKVKAVYSTDETKIIEL